MAYMNHKEGTGIRARSDLSPNQRVVINTTEPLTPEQLVRAAQFLNGLVFDARQRQSQFVAVPIAGALRLVDALLTAAQP